MHVPAGCKKLCVWLPVLSLSRRSLSAVDASKKTVCSALLVHPLSKVRALSSLSLWKSNTNHHHHHSHHGMVPINTHKKKQKKSRTKIASWPGGVCLERALHHQKSARARCGQRPPLLHAAPPPKKHGRKEWLRKLVRAPPTTQRGPRAQAHAKKKKWKKEEDFFASGVVRWVGLVGVCARRLSKHTDKPARGPLNEQAALEIIHFPLHGAAAADDAADDAPAFGRVASSTKYTMPRQLTPLWLLRLISHVRLVE